MEKRKFRLFLIFGVILTAFLLFAVTWLIEDMPMEKPEDIKGLRTVEEDFEVQMVFETAVQDIEEIKESEFSIFEIIRYLCLIIIGLFSILAGYQIFFQRVPDVLSNDLRMNMLLELKEADKIPTYFSGKFKKSKSTIIEHLDKLILAGLVERVQEPGKKFVYYRITREGKNKLREKSAA